MAKQKQYMIPFCVALITLYIVCAVLFYRMAISYQGIGGTYWSDVSIRIEQFWAGEKTYSLFIYPEYFFATSFDLSIGSVFIGLYLAAFVVGTVLLIFVLLKRLCPNVSLGLLAAISFVSVFVMPINVPVLSEYIYNSYCGSVWHNESYLGMRFFALLVLLFFLKTNESYLKTFSPKEFALGCVLVFIVNFVKPNFIIAFAPALLVMMIVDIAKAKGSGFFRWLLYGASVLVGCLILPFQYLLLFNEAETNEDPGVIFVLGDFILCQKHPLLNILFALMFPIIVFIIHRKELVRSKFHMVCLLAWVFAWLEYAFLAEGGSRYGDENFSWGLQLFTFVVFCLSLGFYSNDLQSYLNTRREKPPKKKNIMLFVESILLALHLYCGILYFFAVFFGKCGFLM